MVGCDGRHGASDGLRRRAFRRRHVVSAAQSARTSGQSGSTQGEGGRGEGKGGGGNGEVSAGRGGLEGSRAGKRGGKEGLGFQNFLEVFTLEEIIGNLCLLNLHGLESEV